MLTSGVFSFPTTAPSGNYSGPTQHSRVIERYPDQETMSVSLTVTGRDDISQSFVFTGVGGPEFTATGITTGINLETGFHMVDKALRECPHTFNTYNLKLTPYSGEY